MPFRANGLVLQVGLEEIDHHKMVTRQCIFGPEFLGRKLDAVQRAWLLALAVGVAVGVHPIAMDEADRTDPASNIAGQTRVPRAARRRFQHPDPIAHGKPRAIVGRTMTPPPVGGRGIGRARGSCCLRRAAEDSVNSTSPDNPSFDQHQFCVQKPTLPIRRPEIHLVRLALNAMAEGIGVETRCVLSRLGNGKRSSLPVIVEDLVAVLSRHRSESESPSEIVGPDRRLGLMGR